MNAGLHRTKAIESVGAYYYYYYVRGRDLPGD